MLPLALAQFEPVAGEAAALATGLATSPWSAARSQWRDAVEAVIGPGHWPEPTVGAPAARTVRSAHFSAVYDEVRAVIMIDPTATW
jgi:hypothetical protein